MGRVKANHRELTAAYFRQRTLTVARELLGKRLCRQAGRRLTCATITETEAYCGRHDLASHASRGKTTRTAVMFGPPAYWYVYLVYGMYWCCNVVTGADGYPAAVLIRAVVADALPPKRTNGPGKLCRALGIDGRLNAQPLGRASGLWIENATPRVRDRWIKKTPRIGVPYAGAYRDKPWRFILIGALDKPSRAREF